MQNRKPFNLTAIIRIYNVFQVVACIWFVFQAHGMGVRLSYTWQCVHKKIPVTDTCFNIGWYYMLLRLLELVETVFFVLRKKQNQVSALHVYHHISTASLMWIFLKYSAGKHDIRLIVNLCNELKISPDGMETIIGHINNLVHICMYSYYFLSSFRQLTRFIISFKPILTAIQIIQLVVLIGHCVVAIMPSCGAPKLFYLQFVNIAILIFMFSRFYIKSYVKKEKKQL